MEQTGKDNRLFPGLYSLQWEAKVKAGVRIATWNVNSIRARQERVLAWLAVHNPTVLCLQETKVPDAAFPRVAFEAVGYHVTAYGQRSYNGVALLSHTPAVDAVHQFGDGEEESSAHFLCLSSSWMSDSCANQSPKRKKWRAKLVGSLLRRSMRACSRLCR